MVKSFDEYEDYNELEDPEAVAEDDGWINPATTLPIRALNTMTAGNLDRLGGGLKGLGGAAQALITGEPISEAFARDYDEGVIETRDMLHDMGVENPIAAGTGDLAGYAVGPYKAGALPAAARVAQSAITAEGMADIDYSREGSALEAAKEVGLGTAFGLGGEAIPTALRVGKGLLGKTAKEATEAAPVAKELASEGVDALKALGDKLPPNLKQQVKDGILATTSGMEPEVFRFGRAHKGQLDNALPDMALGKKALERQQLAGKIRNQRSLDAVDALPNAPINLNAEVRGMRAELKALQARPDAHTMGPHIAKLQGLIEVAEKGAEQLLKRSPTYIALGREAADLTKRADDLFKQAKSYRQSPQGPILTRQAQEATERAAQLRARAAEMATEVNLRPKDVKTFVKSAQDLGYLRQVADGDNLEVAQQYARQWSGRINEKLKNEIPAYAKAMEPVSELSAATGKEGVLSLISAKTKPETLGKNLRTNAFSDATGARIFDQLDDVLAKQTDYVAKMAKEGDELAQAYLRDTTRITHSAKVSGTAAAFKADGSRGSRGVMGLAGSGALISSLLGVGPVAGGILGGISGYVLDRNRKLMLQVPDAAGAAAPVVKRLMQESAEMLRNVAPQAQAALEKGFNAVQKAADVSGPMAARAMHLSLMKRDRDYREGIEGLEYEASQMVDPEEFEQAQGLDADSRNRLVAEMERERSEALGGVSPRAVNAAKALLAEREARIDPKARKAAMAASERERSR